MNFISLLEERHVYRGSFSLWWRESFWKQGLFKSDSLRYSLMWIFRWHELVYRLSLFYITLVRLSFILNNCTVIHFHHYDSDWPLMYDFRGLEASGLTMRGERAASMKQQFFLEGIGQKHFEKKSKSKKYVEECKGGVEHKKGIVSAF